MKKKILCSLLLALGMSSTALGANPFSDIPKGHWSYAAVAKLAQAGIIDGYPDGTFQGERTMTRYEMAQIVAKALSKKALSPDDLLVQEYAEELDNLGVRIATLEKKSDNVKISGNLGCFYYTTSKKDRWHSDRHKRHQRTAFAGLISKIGITGTINDNWTYGGTIKNTQKLLDDNGNDKTRFTAAYLEGNFGSTTLTLGRHGSSIADGNTYDDTVDSILVESGDNLKIIGEYGRLSNANEPERKPKPPTPSLGKAKLIGETEQDRPVHHSSADKFARLGLRQRVKDLTLDAEYALIHNVHAMGMKGSNNKIWSIGALYEPSKFWLGARYLRARNKELQDSGLGQNGFVLNLGYGKLKRSTPNSYKIYANYFNQDAATVLAHTMSGPYDHFKYEGFKGYGIGAQYMLAKNIRAACEYHELKGKRSDKKAHSMWTHLAFYF